MATERTADNRKLIGYLSSGALVLGTLMPVTIFYSGPMPMGSATLAHSVFGWLVIGCAAAAAYFVYHNNYERVTLATAGAVLVCLPILIGCAIAVLSNHDPDSAAPIFQQLYLQLSNSTVEPGWGWLPLLGGIAGLVAVSRNPRWLADKSGGISGEGGS